MVAVMVLDLMLLSVYFIFTLISKSGRRLTSVIVFCWFAISMFIAAFTLPAVITFPLYWLLTGVTCIALSYRMAWLPMLGMSAMFVFQFMMSIDAIITDAITPLYANHTYLSLVMNLFIIALTYIHGKGLENVNFRNLRFRLFGRNSKRT